MSVFDRFGRDETNAAKSPAGPDGDTWFGQGGTLETASPAVGIDAGGAAAPDENDGLPAVNRRRGGHKLVNLLGLAAIVSAGAALIVSANGRKDPPQPKAPAAADRVANILPRLVLPPRAPQTAPPPVAAPLPVALAPPLQAAAAPLPRAAVPLPDWSDRKRGGELLVGGGSRAAAALPLMGSTLTKLGMPGAASALGGVSGLGGFGGAGGALGAFAGLGAAGNPAGALPSFGAALDGPGEAGAAGLGAGSAGGGRAGLLARRLEPIATRAAQASLLPDRNFLLAKGATLDCALETALDSTVPGMTTCRLTRDVYSDNGQVLLLDRGAQLVGEYQGGIKQGQARIFVLWTRAKTPHGVVVALDSPGTDTLGRAGLNGWVDTHFGARFGAAIMFSIAKDAMAYVTSQQQLNGTTIQLGNSQQTGERTIDRLLESSINIPPTLIKNQGDHIQVMIARDLDFSRVYTLRATP